MNAFLRLTYRNIKLFFKDKGAFFASMITPFILLLLYVTFLKKVYQDSFVNSFPDGVSIKETYIGAIASGQLLSSLLAVSCVTVAFCSNMVSVMDKINGARKDFEVTPVNKNILSISYFTAAFLNTFFVSLAAFAVGLIYVAFEGWFFSFLDIVMLLLAIFLLTMFGTLLSSIINIFLTSQGQISAVGTIVSSTYGFLAGAYMPLSQYGDFLRNVLMFLPGTYASSIIRNYCLRGVFASMEKDPNLKGTIPILKDSFDCNLYFFKHQVNLLTMFLVLLGSVIVLTGLFLLLNKLKKKKTVN